MNLNRNEQGESSFSLSTNHRNAFNPKILFAFQIGNDLQITTTLIAKVGMGNRTLWIYYWKK